MNEELFNQIINISQDCVFWKDKERRFMGANQAFLDIYGFKSDKILIGRTDEDMGWHTDPEPFKQDELRVLAGESTYKVPGKCEIRGRERDIIASKCPLYENGEIIGLIGSFMDVTEAVRHDALISAHTIYTRDILRQYNYFDKLLDSTGLDEILDPLTGVLSRAYAMDFVHSLIESGTPFTFAIIDLDNFKHINDAYGHHAGDAVLVDVAHGIASYALDCGLVGRYGGDEFLLIDLKNIEYDDKKAFLNDLYNSGDVFRKNVVMEDSSPYITATLGCASFPSDASNYDSLFECIDKTLYRGKSKGRNCYIIYTSIKHKDLTIRKLTRMGIYSAMQRISSLAEPQSSPMDKLKAVMPFLKDEMQITDLYYVDHKGFMRAVLNEDLCEQVGDLEMLTCGDIFYDNSLQEVESVCPAFYSVLSSMHTEALMVVRVARQSKVYGYLVCAETGNLRIWQEDEQAKMFFLAKMLVG